MTHINPFLENDLHLLKKLTVIIPTYNRNFYLSRCLWYLSQFPFNEIIVADSSVEEKKIINREIVKSLSKDNIQYREYKPEMDKLGTVIYQKWADALYQVKSEYSIICTDKEFIIPLTLCKCIKFLEDNEDYGQADGRYCSAEFSHTMDIQFLSSFSTKCALNYENSISRLLVALTVLDASNNLLALRRSDFHKKLYQTIHQYSLEDLRFGEITVEFLSLIRSKHAYFSDEIYKCRDLCYLKTNGRTNKSESSTEQFPNLGKYIEWGIYTEFFSRFQKCIAESIISENEFLPITDAYNIISQSFPRIIDERGFFGLSLSKKGVLHPESFLFILWKKIQPKLRKILKTDDPNQINRVIPSYSHPELKYIEKIITETAHLHISDAPLNYQDLEKVMKTNYQKKK